jgi:hypothetical protein
MSKFKLFLIIVIVSAIGTTFVELLGNAIGHDNLFIGSTIFVALVGLIYVPYLQLKKK